MDFGKVQVSEIDKINFTFTEDSAFTKQTLAGSVHTQKPLIYVGCAKWGIKDWIGKLYPAKTKDADFLQEYVKHFNSIELNATHYKMPDPSGIKNWASKAKNLDFKFCPKFPKTISHNNDLAPSHYLEEQTKDFITGIRSFEEHLGPAFLQLSDQFSPERKNNLFTYLETLPKDLNLFLEVRHHDWYGNKNIREELLDMLSKNNTGAVITDTSGRRDVAHMELTIPKTFVRFIANNLHPSDYVRLDKWVQRIKRWLDEGLQEVYFFMHCSDEKNSPELCGYFIEQMNKHVCIDLQRPKFIKDQLTLF